MTVIDGQTTAPAYAFNVPDGPDGSHYNVIPLITVGDEVPLLEGDFGELTPSDRQTYAMAGIPDGMGYTEIDGLNYVFVNHELSDSVTTDISSTIDGQLNGARVSLYVFDQDWNAIGGKNLIEDVEVDGLTYSWNPATGDYEDGDGNVLNLAGHDNFSRFCSGYLAAEGFVGEDGEPLPVYFAPEEVGEGYGIAVDADGNATPILGMGVYAKEQVYAPSQYRADNSDKTVLLGMEDVGDGEIYLYVGDQTEDDPNGFNDTTDSLYVLRVKDADGNIFAYEDLPENVELTGEWVAVPDRITLNTDPGVLGNWVNNSFNTLTGNAPLVIGHRGASGELPEHTLEAYQLAIEQGADFVEPDLVITKDGVLIARHEPLLDDTTNVAEVFGPERMSTKMLDGEEVTAYFAEDFTLEEIKQLRAVQSRSYRDQSFNNQFEIPTFQEVIELVQQVEAETATQIGIYPETKHPTFFDQQGLSLEEPLIQTLQDNGFTDPSRIFIQSFEVANLIDLQNNLLPVAGLENLPLVQLYGDVEDDYINEGGGGFSVPYDIVANFSNPDFDADDARETYGDLVDIVPDFGADVDGDNIPDTSYQDLFNPEVIAYIGEAYAEGLGPWKNSFILRQSLDTPVDGDGDSNAEITSQLTGEVRPLIDWANDAGLQVHPYTLRNEERFLTLNPDGTPQTPEDEFRQLTEIGVDGFFTDFPETGRMVVDEIIAEKAGDLNSTNFRRPEDIHEDPNNPGVFYLVTTGRSEKNGSLTEQAETPEEADNPYGKLHRLILNPEDPTGDVTFEFLMDGGPETGVSYDNMTVDSNGNVLIQEDSTAFGADVLEEQQRHSGIVSYNIAANEGVVGEDTVTFLFENNTAFIDPSQFDNYGDWESSGIIEVLGGSETQSAYLFDIQAHSIRDAVDESGVGLNDDGEGDIQFYEGRYAQGGQILLAVPAAEISASGEFVGSDVSEILRGSVDADTVAGGLGDDLIDGGDGDDVLRGDNNSRSPGGSVGGNDEIYGGPGNDRIGGKAGNDFISGGEGDDEIWGDDGWDILSGGPGNDTLTGDDFSGGEGRDTFILAAGEGTDTIVDFEVGVDSIGVFYNTIAPEDLSFMASDSSTLVKLGDETLAVLEGVVATVDDINIRVITF